MELIQYDPSGVYLAEHGIQPSDLQSLTGQLEAARAEVLQDAEDWKAGRQPPPAKNPLDAGFIDLPGRLLAESLGEDKGGGQKSLLNNVLRSARAMREKVDAVVLLGIGGSYMGARAVFEALCHPYHNELPRKTRNDVPRLYFEGDNVDNDAAAALLELLQSGDAKGLADRWGIVVISKSGGTLETAAAFRFFREALEAFCAGNSVDAKDVIIPVTGGAGSKLRAFAEAKGNPLDFPVPDGVGGRFSVLSAVGLLPAALLGLDIHELLRGADAMNRHFREAAPQDNVVLQYVGVCHLLEYMRGCTTRVLSTWGKQLEAVGLWYDQLLAESLGKEERGALPLTVVNTRDLHSRGQQHQEGPRDKLITNLFVESPGREPLTIGTSGDNQDGLNELAGKSLPDILVAARQGTNQAYREANRPTADIVVPQLNEHTLGQLFQIFMLATVVEGRLIGINPYGQPGVEAYKKNMNAILRGTG